MKQSFIKLCICIISLTTCLWEMPLRACEEQQDEQAQLQIDDAQSQPDSLEVVLQETTTEAEPQKEE